MVSPDLKMALKFGLKMGGRMAIFLFIVGSFLYAATRGQQHAADWHSGDELVLVGHPVYRFYDGCKITYIAGLATATDNVVFVQLSDCKNAELQNPDADMIPKSYLRKVAK